MDETLLKLLVCPKTREPLVWDKTRHELVSPAAGLAYPIRDGIPIMLVEEARVLDTPSDREDTDRESGVPGA